MQIVDQTYALFNHRTFRVYWCRVPGTGAVFCFPNVTIAVDREWRHNDETSVYLDRDRRSVCLNGSINDRSRLVHYVRVFRVSADGTEDDAHSNAGASRIAVA